MPVSAAQMSYVHTLGHTTFVFCDFLENRFSRHSTFVPSTIFVVLTGLFQQVESNQTE